MSEGGHEEDQHEARAGSPANSESEWEYETETQEFYFTIDLSAAVAPPAQAQPAETEDKPATRKKKGKRKKDEPSKDEDEEQTPAPRRRRSTPKKPDTIPAVTEEPTDNGNPDRMQVLDLQESNPLISYRGRIYSCHWASAIGTDLFFAKPAQSPAVTASSNGNHADAPKEPDTGFVGMSSARLVARNAELFWRPGVGQDDQQAQYPEEEEEAAGSFSFKSSIPVPKMWLPPAPNKSMKQQASFIERLAVAKVRRNKTDSMNITSREGELSWSRTPPEPARVAPTSRENPQTISSDEESEELESDTGDDIQEETSRPEIPQE